MADSLGCKACAEADENPLTGSYGASCLHCAARSLAHSPWFFETTARRRFTPEYAQALHRIFGPDVSVRDAAHQSVKAWDKVIREARAAKAIAGNPPFEGATQEDS